MTSIPGMQQVGAAAQSQAVDPGDKVGSGDGLARFVGAVVGGGLGLGITAGLTYATRGSSLPLVKYGAVGLGLATAAGAGFAGQSLLGSVTRQTRAEAGREARATREDAQIEARMIIADAEGRLERGDKSDVNSLRSERRGLVTSPRSRELLGYASPVAGGIAGAIGGGFVGAKAAPPDSKGMNQMFGAIAGAGFGGFAGVMGGITLGDVIGRGDAKAEIPAADVARIAEIDAELDQILGTD